MFRYNCDKSKTYLLKYLGSNLKITFCNDGLYTFLCKYFDYEFGIYDEVCYMQLKDKNSSLIIKNMDLFSKHHTLSGIESFGINYENLAEILKEYYKNQNK